MAIFFQLPDRRVIPNWRDYKRTVTSGELSSSKVNDINLSIDITKQINDWKAENSMGMAADLLSAAYLSKDRQNKEVFKASKFILENSFMASQPLLDIAKETLNPSEKSFTSSIDKMDIRDIIEINSEKSLAYIINWIGQAKKDTNINPYNPITWVELSRLYSIIGQSDKAVRAMKIAVNLAPNNRFVLRSATRLFVHVDDPDRALFYLRKSLLTKSDPWLLSAHIAISALLNKHQVNANIAKEIIGSKRFSNFEITELSSSLGTLEYKNGAFKSSKKFFEMSQKAPNDNSLAQLEWISHKDSRFTFNPLEYSNVFSAYEAFAAEQFEREKWDLVLENAVKWFYDMPYSSEPVVLGSFVSLAFLENQESAIKFCELGLIANPNDPAILNNLIYACALAGENEMAVKYSQVLNTIVEKSDIPNHTLITIQATMGLVAFRTNEIDLGMQFYERAIDNARKLNRKDLELLALTNFLRELILSKRPEVEGVSFSLNAINENEVPKHVRLIKNKVVEMYKKHKSS